MSFARAWGGIAFVLCGALGSTLGNPVQAQPLTVATASVHAPRGSYHEDEQFGYRIKPPKKWTAIPMKPDEQWLIAKYLCDRVYHHNDPQGWSWEFQPELKVIAFIEQSEEDKAKGDVEQNGDELIVRWSSPYKDYENYLDRTYSGGGFFIAEKEREKVGDHEATKYVVKVEKLSYNGPKRIITWVHHTPGVDIAVQIEVLEDSYKKLKSTVSSVQKSFKAIPRKGRLPGQEGRTTTIRIGDLHGGTPETRRTARIASQQKIHDQAVSRLTDGWDYEYQGEFLVLTNADAKHAKRIADHANAMLKWLDENLDFVGKGEYVRKPILRVCKNREEADAYEGDWVWFSSNLEIVTYKDDSGFLTGWAVDNVNRSLYRHWLNERDSDLASSMPGWMDSGLRNYLENARAKGRKIEFRRDDWERDDLREMVREERAVSPRELLGMTDSNLYSSGYWDRHRECSALVRYLMTDGKKKKLTKNLLKDYLSAQSMVMEELKQEAEKSTKEKDDGEPKTEKEEEEHYRKVRENWKKRELEIVEKTWPYVFGHWKDKDWKAFEKAYFASIK